MDKELVTKLGVAIVARDENQLSNIAAMLAGKYSMSEIKRIWTCVESELTSKDIVWVSEALQGKGELIELSKPLTLEEQAHKQTIETRWKDFLGSFVDRGNDLIYLRDNKLYRDEYPSWKTYCQFKLGIHERQSFRLMDAANIVNQLKQAESPPELLPSSESVARELVKCKPETRPLVWDIVVEKSEDEAEPITANFVKEVIKEIKSSKQSDTPPLEINSGEIVKFKRGKSAAWGEVQCDYTEGTHIIFDGSKEITVKDKYISKFDGDYTTANRVKLLSTSGNKVIQSISSALHFVFKFDEWHLQLIELLEKQCSI